MVLLAMQKAKIEFNANLLTLNVFSHNKSALKCYEKLGFKTTQLTRDNWSLKARFGSW